MAVKRENEREARRKARPQTSEQGEQPEDRRPRIITREFFDLLTRRFAQGPNPLTKAQAEAMAKEMAAQAERFVSISRNFSLKDWGELVGESNDEAEMQMASIEERLKNAEADTRELLIQYGLPWR